MPNCPRRVGPEQVAHLTLCASVTLTEPPKRPRVALAELLADIKAAAWPRFRGVTAEQAAVVGQPPKDFRVTRGAVAARPTPCEGAESHQPVPNHRRPPSPAQAEACEGGESLPAHRPTRYASCAAESHPEAGSVASPAC